MSETLPLTSKRYFIMGLAFFAAALTPAYYLRGALDILGPRDKPNFAGFDWVFAKVTYKVKTGEPSTTSRSFVIDDPEALRYGFSLFESRKISGYSLGVGTHVTLKTRDGTSWNMNPVFPDRIDFGSVENPWRTYAVETSTTCFFDWLAQQCLHDARKRWPNVQLQSIVLEENLALSCYRTLDD